MQVSYGGLVQLLNQNIIEVRFKRKHFKPGFNIWRRMLCTNNPKVLKSLPGRIALHYKDPKGIGIKYSPEQHKLVITWDIFYQEFRHISLDIYDIVTVIPSNAPQDLEKWWAYFNTMLLKMPASEKIRFMNG